MSMSTELNDLHAYFRRENFKRSYGKDHVICSQGDSFNSIFMIESGMVKMYDLDATGSERTITIFARHTIFPSMWLLREPPRYHLYYYEAFTDVTCYVAPLEKSKAFIRSHPEILLSLSDILAKSYINSAARVRNLEKSHIHERLEFVLYLLAMRLGEIHDNIAVISAAITQEDIAALAGVTRESMSLAINRAGSKGVVWKEGRTTFINLNLINTETMPPIYAN